MASAKTEQKQLLTHQNRFRAGINQEEDQVVCGEADDADRALAIIETTEPDLDIVDISLKERDGIGLVCDIRKLHMDMPVLVLSMHDESRFAERSLLAGAKGYIMKRETTELIVEAARCVVSGKVYLGNSGELIRQAKLGVENEQMAVLAGE